jgi:ubiquinone/menaquinone biosynthesis C-methylase UbiE
MKHNRVVERMAVEPESLYYHEHVARYRFAKAQLGPGWTLDIACGTGYGVTILGQEPSRPVVGVDIHVPSLVRARSRYSDLTAQFLAANGTSLPFCRGVFANIVTLETIEHIVDDRRYLAELTRVLRPDGVCVLSTPNRNYSVTERIINPYHVREYCDYELITLLSAYFESVTLYYQGFSAQFAERLCQYSEAIKAEKQRLPLFNRFLIDRLYRSFKSIIPSRLTNFFVKHWLRLAYPQPEPVDITISPSEMPKASVLIAVCRQPIQSVQIVPA